MEHFPAPEGTKLIDVPYIGTEDYDAYNGKFKDYPQHKGWSDSQLKGDLNFGNRSHDKVEVFFQTWLYFGCLISVFKVVGIELQTKNFIYQAANGEKYITTKALLQTIQQWRDMDEKDEEADDGESTEKGRVEHARSIKTILDEVLLWAKRYCGEKNVDPDVPPSPISPPIAMSIIALGSTLSNAATEIYVNLNPMVFRRYLTPHWPSSLLLKERLQRNGWCPRDISQFQDNGSVDCDYYFGSIPSPRKDQNHSGCTEGRCFGGNVNLNDYRTKHSDSYPLTCKDIEAYGVVEIIKNGKIPLVCFNQHEASLSVVKYEPNSNMKYVAISHMYVCP